MDPNLNKHFGTVGRTSNRIANAQFNLESVTYSLTKNDGENLVHGGTYGFDMVFKIFLILNYNHCYILLIIFLIRNHGTLK